MKSALQCPNADYLGQHDTEAVHTEVLADAIEKTSICHTCAAQWRDAFSYSHHEVDEEGDPDA